MKINGSNKKHIIAINSSLKIKKIKLYITF